MRANGYGWIWTLVNFIGKNCITACIQIASLSTAILHMKQLITLPFLLPQHRLALRCLSKSAQDRGGRSRPQSQCHDWIVDSRFRNKLKLMSLSSMLMRTYFGLTPKCLPPLVKILCPFRKLSQSSTASSSHLSHAKAADKVNEQLIMSFFFVSLKCHIIMFVVNFYLPGRGCVSC